MAALELPEAFHPLLAPARYKGAWGGRGSGKSHSFAGMAVLQMVSRERFRIVCLREVQRSIAASVKRLIEDKIKALGLQAFFRITDTEIRGINGSLCIFLGLQTHTSDAVKSLEGFDVAWVEEAQSISQRSLDVLIPTIRKPGSELWFSWNPGAETDPVDVLLRSSPPEDAIVIKMNWSDNPWFPAELREDMLRDKERNPDKYWHVWEGQYRTRSEARVFRNWRAGVIDPPEGVVWFYGADWGFSVDPTAAVRCCVVGRTLYIDHEVYEFKVPTERLPALLMQMPGASEWPMRGDSAMPQTIDYLRRHGFPKLRGATKGKGSVEDGINFLQGFDMVVNPRCANTLHELANYAYKIDRQTEEILPVVSDDNNHCIDALRYAVERLHRKGTMLEAAPLAALPEKPNDYTSSARQGVDDWKVT